MARNDAYPIADLSKIVLPRAGKVVATTDPALPWHVEELDQNQDIAR